MAEAALECSRLVTFTFTLDLRRDQHEVLRRHLGARRFAYNQGLRFVKDALDEKRQVREHRGEEAAKAVSVPWSGYDLINAFNQWKTSKAAGDEDGEPGLAWRHEVTQQVFEEALQDLGQALAACSRSERKAGFPRFRKRGQGEESFRLRQNGTRLQVGAEELPRSLVLARAIGVVSVHEDTRKLRRLIQKGATLQSMTITERRGSFKARVLVKAPPLAAAQRLPENGSTLGFDRGFIDLVVVSNAGGTKVGRAKNPHLVRRSEAKLVRLSQSFSRTQKGSKRRAQARFRLNKHHDHVVAQKRHLLHHLANDLVKTQARLVGEDLSLESMAQRHGKSIQEAALGELMCLLEYKLSWRDRELVRASRWYPSTRRCSDCGYIGPKLDESVRWFQCEACGYAADRDLNAARNLAQWPGLPEEERQLYVAGKRSETLNARRVEASAAPVGSREPEASVGESRASNSQGTPGKGVVLTGNNYPAFENRL